MKIDHLKSHFILKVSLWIISIRHPMNKNPLFIQSTIKQTYVIPVIKHFLSLHLTQTLQKSHERGFPWKSEYFFWIWRYEEVTRTPPQANHRVLVHSPPVPSTRYPLVLRGAGPTFPVRPTTGHKTLVAKALCVHRVKQTSPTSPFLCAFSAGRPDTVCAEGRCPACPYCLL